MPGLVCEGGTLRSIFTAGALDALLDEDLMFPYCIGVSAGACQLTSYISKQWGRSLDILLRYRHDKRYVSWHNWLKERSYFGLEFVYDEIPNQLLPFDYDQYYAYEGEFKVGAINALTGEIEYLDALVEDRKNTRLQATCAIPLAFPPIYVDGVPYFDGGIMDSVPVTQSIADGHKRNLIILTQPEGYVKKLTARYTMGAKVLRKDFPAMVDVLLTRHIRYNDLYKLCDELEAAGEAVVLRPTYELNSMEKSPERIKENYQHGYDQAMAQIDKIKQLFA